jgi:ABC-type transporter Mla subunit MlaD
VYVDLHPGDTRQPLASGARLGRARAAVQLNDVVTGFDASARRAFAQVAATGGAGVAARGPQLNSALASLPPLLHDANTVLTAVRPAPGALHDVLARGTSVLDAAGGADGALGESVRGARDVLEPAGAQAAAVRATLGAAPAVEATVQNFATDAGPLLRAAAVAARRLGPATAGLSRALPSLRAAERAGAGVAVYAAAARLAVPSMNAAAPALRAADGPAAGLVPFAAPLADFARGLLPYGDELREAPLGFTRWGDFRYDFGQAPGHRAVRFSMIFTCARARDPYPAPGAASTERSKCG